MPASTLRARAREALARLHPATPFLLFAGLYFLYRLHGGTWIPGDLGDTRFNLVIMEHVRLWALGHDVQLWSPGFFHPYTDALALSENHFGSVWAYILFRLPGMDMEHALVGWFLVGVALTYWAAYWVTRRLGYTAFASAAGAFVFTLALPVLAQAGHVQLTHRYAVPLAFLAYWRLRATRRLTPLWLLVAAVSWQFFCSVYLGLFLCYLLAACVLVHPLARVQPDRETPAPAAPWRAWAAFALAAASLAGLGLMLAKYRAVSAAFGFVRSDETFLRTLPRVWSYLLADGAPLSRWLNHLVVAEIPVRHEHQLFMGQGVLLLAACGAVAAWSRGRGRDVGRVALLAAVVLVLFTLNVPRFAPYNSIYMQLIHLPGVNSIRAVARIIFILLFPVSLLVAGGVEAIQAWAARFRPVARAAVALGLVLAVCAESVCYSPPFIPIAEMRERHDRMAALLRAQLPANLPQRPVLYLVTAAGDNPTHTELDGMLLAQELGWPTLNGYSGNFPPGYGKLVSCDPPMRRLREAARFLKLPDAELEALAGRVVTVWPESCPGAP